MYLSDSPVEAPLQDRIERAVAAAVDHLDALWREAEERGWALDKLTLYELRDDLCRPVDLLIERAL